MHITYFNHSKGTRELSIETYSGCMCFSNISRIHHWSWYQNWSGQIHPKCNPWELPIEEERLPFPWTRCEREHIAPPVHRAEAESRKRARVCRSRGGVVLEEQPWYSQLVCPCQPLGCIDFQVSKLGSSAGGVLKHSLRVLESMFAKHDPCIFKIGWSHNPAWRWTNPIYGYATAVDGWSNMIVLHVAEEPFTPAMLEAALIEKHFGDLAWPWFPILVCPRFDTYLLGVWLDFFPLEHITLSCPAVLFHAQQSRSKDVLGAETWGKAVTQQLLHHVPHKSGTPLTSCTDLLNILLRSQSWQMQEHELYICFLKISRHFN